MNREDRELIQRLGRDCECFTCGKKLFITVPEEQWCYKSLRGGLNAKGLGSHKINLYCSYSCMRYAENGVWTKNMEGKKEGKYFMSMKEIKAQCERLVDTISKGGTWQDGAKAAGWSCSEKNPSAAKNYIRKRLTLAGMEIPECLLPQKAFVNNTPVETPEAPAVEAKVEAEIEVVEVAEKAPEKPAEPVTEESLAVVQEEAEKPAEAVPAANDIVPKAERYMRVSGMPTCMHIREIETKHGISFLFNRDRTVTMLDRAGEIVAGLDQDAVWGLKNALDWIWREM